MMHTQEVEEQIGHGAAALAGSPHGVPVLGLLSCAPFPGFFAATVQGTDEGGAPFEESVPLDGHLEGELYLRLRRRVSPGAKLFIVLRVLPALADGLYALRMALGGTVERAHCLPGGECDLRVSVNDYQML